MDGDQECIFMHVFVYVYVCLIIFTAWNYKAKQNKFFRL